MAERALLLLEKSANQQVVRACSARALDVGIRQGMTLALARAIRPDAQTLPFEQARDRRRLKALAVWALRFSPMVSLDPEVEALSGNPDLGNGLTIDISGTDRLHGGKMSLLQKVAAEFARRGVRNRLAIAPSIGAAWALSRYGSEELTLVDGSIRAVKQALLSLDVRALRISSDVSLALSQVGIEKISDLLKLPPEKLNIRFGPQLLKRINQALGYLEEPLEVLRHEQCVEVKRAFEFPLQSQEAVGRALLDLFSRAFHELDRRALSCGEFQLEFCTLDAMGRRSLCRKRLSLHAASRNLKSLSRLLESVIASVGIRAGLHSLALSSCVLERRAVQQGSLVPAAGEASPAAAAAGECLFDRLSTELGPNGLQSMHRRKSHLPDKSFAFEKLNGLSGLAAQREICEMSGVERPSCLFPSPQPVSVVSLLPDAAPVRLVWNRRRFEIIKASGPEQICGEWWETLPGSDARWQGEERDYYRLQDDTGRWLWVFRDRNMKWFVHGLWV